MLALADDTPHVHTDELINANQQAGHDCICDTCSEKLPHVDEKGNITAKPGVTGKSTIKGVYGGRSIGFTLEVTK